MKKGRRLAIILIGYSSVFRMAYVIISLCIAAYYFRFKPKDDDEIIVSSLDELAENYHT